MDNRQENRKKFKRIVNYDTKKYRKSIIEAMDEEKTKKFGFEKAYIIFERSINRMEKEGDEAEKLAIEYLKEKKLLSSNYSTNRVVTLGTIKIEADIIDYDKKIIYETKSRKTSKAAKQAVIKKWKVFEYDKKNSNYENFSFIGITVINYSNGKKVRGLITFEGKVLKNQKIKEDFEKYFEKLKKFKKITKK